MLLSGVGSAAITIRLHWKSLAKESKRAFFVNTFAEYFTEKTNNTVYHLIHFLSENQDLTFE
jgi:hypothetical protein